MSFKRCNSLSGIYISDHSKDAFLELKRKKGHRYVVFKIDEKKKEVVVSVSCKNKRMELCGVLIPDINDNLLILEDGTV